MKPSEKDHVLSAWQDLLHRNGFRITRPRLQVMEIIASSKTALTPQEIYQKSLVWDQSPGIASVYRTLELLDDLGLIQQIHQPGGCHGIWPTVEGHKHFLICRNCGSMMVIEGDEDITGYIDNIEKQTGYRVDDHWLQFFGTCRGCLD